MNIRDPRSESIARIDIKKKGFGIGLLSNMETPAMRFFHEQPMGFLAIYDFATTPLDKVVSKGIFHYSRNPMYLSFFILSIGISLVSISWIYFLIALIWMVLIHFMDIPIEESECIKKYGMDYKGYMERTPQWIGLPKSKK